MVELEKKYNEGIRLLKVGNYSKSLIIFDELIKNFPNEADFWSERGVIYFHLQNRNKSLFDMDKAVELQAKKSYRYSSRAYIRGHYKMTSEAIEDYKKAIKLDPEDAVAQNNLGMLEEQMGYKMQADQHFKIADDLMKDKVDGRSDHGIEGEPLETRNIQKEIDEENAKKSLWSEMLKIISKDGRKSFSTFIKSGFKKT